MQAIIAGLLIELAKYFGPKVVEWFKGLFTKVAPAEGDAETLVKAAYAATPRRKLVKRGVLLWLMPRANALAAGEKLTRADRDELKATSKGIEKE